MTIKNLKKQLSLLGNTVSQEFIHPSLQTLPLGNKTIGKKRMTIEVFKLTKKKGLLEHHYFEIVNILRNLDTEIS